MPGSVCPRVALLARCTPMPPMLLVPPQETAVTGRGPRCPRTGREQATAGRTAPGAPRDGRPCQELRGCQALLDLQGVPHATLDALREQLIISNARPTLQPPPPSPVALRAAG